MVGCYQVGKSEEVSENPPTVLILVNVRSTRETIIRILAQYDLNMVAVEIAKDVISRSGFIVGDLDRAAFKGSVKPGRSLGIQADNMAASAFGGYLELKYPRSGEWRKFGLTCFHCVLPHEERTPQAISELCKGWRENGIQMNEHNAKRHLRMHSPSLVDMHRKLQLLESEITEGESGETYKKGSEMEKEGLLDMMSEIGKRTFLSRKAEIDNQKNFVQEIRDFCARNSYQLGSVVAASGFRHRKVPSIAKSDSLMNVDWGLIQIEGVREGPNEPVGAREDIPA
ncbi:hypothetical protein BDV29DRAFT_153772 [Aspergillus leporis]|uniref:Uncharacterized protein n=1 Tax=Aspergillus leporis TaxID=41062 RepID=A0A5N5XB81_9EURO|nr:hypothetical protein BDV29DRAFT_153772 [Aspergillus leporis]